MSKQKQTETYETALRELQLIVAQLQDEAIGMDDLAAKVARATELLQFCRSKLRETGREVEALGVLLQ